MPTKTTQTVEPVKNHPVKSKATAALGQPASKGVDVRELLKAGAHFGHKTSRWDPKMKPYIHSERGGIYIIDLIQTSAKLNQALGFVESVAAEGRQVLFVGTKRHIKDIVRKAAESAKMPYVNQRWLGGTLTNFETIFKRVKQLKRLDEQLESGELAENSSKRELGETKEEIVKLNLAYGGIKILAGLPAAIFVADCIGDRIAVREARRLGIPVLGIVDTNANPQEVDYPIPANDDAVSCVSLISNAVAAAVLAGKAKAKPQAQPQTQTQTAEPSPEAPAKRVEESAAILRATGKKPDGSSLKGVKKAAASAAKPRLSKPSTQPISSEKSEEK